MPRGLGAQTDDRQKGTSSADDRAPRLSNCRRRPHPHPHLFPPARSNWRTRTRPCKRSVTPWVLSGVFIVRKARRHYSPQEKVAILRRYLLDRVSATQFCDDLQLQPSVFYRWLKQFFENGCRSSKPTRSQRSRCATRPTSSWSLNSRWANGR